ncbi:hypothetical protein N9L06_00620 [Mariniblastus sp.]|nr:hypothetical protein [Mariniblastus sp.]
MTQVIFLRFGMPRICPLVKLVSLCCILFSAAVSFEPVQGQVPDLPQTLFNYADLNLPAHYTNNALGLGQDAAIEFDSTPASNPVTNEGATLGRVLFYDARLSANGTISCASCHQAEFGFSDPAVLSVGFDGGLTRRHSMGLTNARYSVTGKYFWDERAATLEDQVLQPFQDAVEMGLTLAQLEQIVSEQPYYSPLFEAAFGDDAVSSDRIALALAQFIRSMVSTTSRYDQARSAVGSPLSDFPGFTDSENDGKSLFFQRTPINRGGVTCATCHVSEAFVGPMLDRNDTTNASNIGLDAESTDDLGIFESTGNPDDIGKYKATSLRNIGVTAPFMHDGRFADLEEVVEHYSTGIQAHDNLDRLLVGNGDQPARFEFSETEKASLVAFMHTLTDEAMLADEKFSDPFILQGDFDEDGDVDSDDIEFYATNIGSLAEGDLAALDLDGDGSVTIVDHNLLISNYVQTSTSVGTLIGDIDLNGSVDVLGDAFKLIASLGQSGTDWSSGDLNADNETDVLGDAFLLISNLGASTEP